MRLGPTVIVAALLIPASLRAQESPICADGRSKFPGVTISATYDVKSQDLSVIALEALADTGFSVEDSTFSEQIAISSTPRFTWPQGAENEDWHGDDHPGVQVFVRLSPTGNGDATELSVSSIALCKVTGPDPDSDVESMVSLMATLEVTAKISEILDE